jgi:hypothetical protein
MRSWLSWLTSAKVHKSYPFRFLRSLGYLLRASSRVSLGHKWAWYNDLDPARTATHCDALDLMHSILHPDLSIAHARDQVSRPVAIAEMTISVA